MEARRLSRFIAARDLAGGCIIINFNRGAGDRGRGVEEDRGVGEDRGAGDRDRGVGD